MSQDARAFRLAVCIPTRNRAKRLEACLAAVRRSERMPILIVVSDDSTSDEQRFDTRSVAQRYDATYIVGPRKGLCANRNNCLAHIGDATHVQCLDDDCEEPVDFIANAERHYGEMHAEDVKRMVLVGKEVGLDGNESWKYRMTFRGWYAPSAIAEIPPSKATVFPKEAFSCARWNEDIFFGYEDADLAFQLKAAGFELAARADLTIRDLGVGMTSFSEVEGGRFLRAHLSAARLHVGLKRFLYYRWRPDLAILYFLYAAFSVVKEAVRMGAARHIADVFLLTRFSRLMKPPFRQPSLPG